MSAWDSLKAWRGKTTARSYPLPTESVDVSAALAASGADLDYSSDPLRAIYVGDPFSNGATPSLVYIKLLDDSDFTVWDCVKGECIKGVIVAVGASTTALKLVGLR